MTHQSGIEPQTLGSGGQRLNHCATLPPFSFISFTLFIFRPSDEDHPTVKPDGYVDNLAQAVDLYLKHR